MRLRGRVDANQKDIKAALQDAGCTVASLANVGGGVPDLLVGLRGRNILVEVVGEAKRKRFPPDGRSDNQREWHRAWRGEVITVTSADDALRQLGLLGVEMIELRGTVR